MKKNNEPVEQESTNKPALWVLGLVVAAVACAVIAAGVVWASYNRPAIIGRDRAGAAKVETSPAGIAALVSQAVAPPDAVAVFNKGGCAGCHTIPGIPGANGRVGPNLSAIGVEAAERIPGLTAEAYIRQSILDPGAFIAPKCPAGDCPEGVMLQTFAQSLNQTDLDTIVGYLSALGTGQEIALREAASSPPILNVSLPPESVLQPFAALPREPASEAQIALGKYLFFDSRLSNNNSLSCASCHQPGKAFSDGQALSRGYPSTQYFRNTPTLYNTAYSNYLYWDGRMDGNDMPTLVRDHLTEAHFMNNDGRLMVERLNQIPAYVDLFNQAFNSGPGFGGALKAISAYVQTLNSPPVAYDRYLAGDASALLEEERAGLALFEGKAGCSACHTGPLFSDGDFYNLDIPADPTMLANPERRAAFRRFFSVFGVPDAANLQDDAGLYALTMDEDDRGKFRVPSLREVSRTAPYMHNGSLLTLENVLRFYNQGGGPNQSAGLQALNLSDAEIAQLLAFLQSLSSPPVAVEIPALPNYQIVALGSPETAPAEQFNTTVVARDEFPPLAPLPPPVAPPDNPSSPEKIELGRLLFFDPRMSGDGSMSCNSCHPSTSGWTAPTPISFAGPGTSHWRNASSLINVAYYSYLNWDGGKKSLEQQAGGAWGGAVAANVDKDLAEARLAQIPDYVALFKTVYGADTPHWNDALKAVATYQRTIVSRNVPFDAYLNGDDSAVSDAAKRGYDLFQGEAACIACHNGPLAADNSFHATGVPQNPDFLNSPLRQVTFRYEQLAKGVPQNVYETTANDLGFYYVTKQETDKGKFRAPSLRDLCYTAPYMHNGVFSTLDEVVSFYNAGGGDTPNKSPFIKPLNLTTDEQNDLIAFLESLCGDKVTDEAPALPPYGDFSLPTDNE